MIWCCLIMGAVIGMEPPALELVGRFDLGRIPEGSGIVKSRRHPGIFWVHNDSGNVPLLFAVRIDGGIVQSFRVSVPNLDWEDLATDNAGHLFLGDIGNNLGLLRVRVIYRIDEPDPAKPLTAAIVPSASYFFALPATNRFDAESLIYEDGLARLIVKAHDGRGAEMFTLDTAQPAAVNHAGKLSAAGRLPGFVEPATGASLSKDGQRLAVCSTSVVRVYRRGLDQGWSLWSEVKYAATAVEGVTWDGGDLVLVAEGIGLYRMRERTLKLGIVGSRAGVSGGR